MAKRPAGVVYVAGGAGSSKRSTVDPVTGIITPGPSISLSSDISVGIQGLAFNSAGVLYAVNNPVPALQNPPFKLYTINTTTGVGTFVGLVNGVITALEFGPGDVLYAWEVGTGLGLVTIGPATGAIADVNPAIGGTAAQVLTLAFSPGRVLWGANTGLSTIDVATGALTPVAALAPAIGFARRPLGTCTT